MKKKNINFDELLETWPSPFVARCKIEEFTKGLFKMGTMNTYDGARKGIKREIRLGTKVCYLKQDVIDWLKERGK